MKIIDANKDYYDYMQNVLVDDKFTFDRRDSYNLTKEELAKEFTYSEPGHKLYYASNSDKERLLLLQVGNCFWLFLLEGTKFKHDINNHPYCFADYKLELLATWRNYNLKRELIKLATIIVHRYDIGLDWDDEFNYRNERVIKRCVDLINNNNIKFGKYFDKFYIEKNGIKEYKHIPILKNIGIPALVDAQDIYLALEEYFSLEKTESERTESIGLTDKEKIINHGFDVKTSFRGK